MSMAGQSNFVSVLSAEGSAEIRALLESYKNDKSKVVPIKQKIMVILIKEGVAIRRLLTPHQVIAHPHNRDKQIITASGIELRAGRVVAVGFSLPVMEEGAWAFEENPFDKRISSISCAHYKTDPRFPTYKASHIVAGSVGAGHTNATLASVIDECPCSDPAISKDGKYNKAAWFLNPDVAQACTVGAQWWVARWEVEQEFPILPHIFQSALNAPSHVSEGLVYS
jgi:hypothetical protein